jgi:hypothetical protein
MALNRIQAARLLSDKEMALFESSLSDQVRGLDDKELTKRVRQLRTQRDKFQDVYRRQRVATRSRTGTKSGPRGVSNERTSQKQEAFAQALQRLEKEQQRREAVQERQERAERTRAKRPAASSRPRTAAKSTKAPARRPAGAAPAGKGSQAPRSVSTRQRAQAMGQARTLAHVSSRGKRQQARRDSR